MGKNSNAGIVRNLMMVTQLGISVLAPVILCTVVGILLKGWFGGNGSLVCLVLGIMAGARNGYVLAKKIIDKNEEKKDD